MIVTSIVEQWIDPEEVRKVFESAITYGVGTAEVNLKEGQVTYEQVDQQTGEVKTVVTELDELTGLPLVPKETIFSKYGLRTYPNNSFHISLNNFFDKNGYLTPRQLNALRSN